MAQAKHSAPPEGEDRRAEFLRLKREDMQEFMANWNFERRNGYYVPAHMMFMTGLILRELMEFGAIETDGEGYAPTETGKRLAR